MIDKQTMKLKEKIIKLYFIDKLTQRKVANKLMISTGRVNRIIKEIMVENPDLKTVHGGFKERKYYVKNKDKFTVFKSINNKNRYFGSYDSEDEAKKVVSKLKETNWDERKLESIKLEVKKETEL
jgi:transcriptional regulator with XRE-family HTH domain